MEEVSSGGANKDCMSKANNLVFFYFTCVKIKSKDLEPQTHYL